jgi:hypothetical protein
MNRGTQNLIMAGSCLFFVVISLAGLAAVLILQDVTGVDGLMLAMVCAGMALLFAWLFVSVLREGGLLGAKSPAENKAPAPSPAAPHAAAAPAVASKEEGK